MTLISSKLVSNRCEDTDCRPPLDKLPVEEENADPDRLARLAMECAKRDVLDVLDGRRMVVCAESGAGVDCKGEVG